MEVVVGLLLVLGTILKETEGLRCSDSGRRKIVDCPTGTCARIVNNRIVLDNGTVVNNGTVGRTWCYTSLREQCLQKEFNGTEFCTDSEENEEKLRNCRSNKNDANNHNFMNEGDEMCFCFTDRCSPSGRSTPNAQVILTILVAASAYTFNVGRGSS